MNIILHVNTAFIRSSDLKRLDRALLFNVLLPESQHSHSMYVACIWACYML